MILLSFLNLLSSYFLITGDTHVIILMKSLILISFSFLALVFCSGAEEETTTRSTRSLFNRRFINDQLYWDLRFSFTFSSSQLEESFRIRSKFDRDDDGDSFGPEFKELWSVLVQKYPNLNCSFYDDEMEAGITYVLSNRDSVLFGFNDIESSGNYNVSLENRNITLENFIFFSLPIPTPKLSSELVLQYIDRSDHRINIIVIKHLIFKALLEPRQNIMFFKSLCTFWKVTRSKLLDKIRSILDLDSNHNFYRQFDTLVNYEKAQFIIAKRWAGLYVLVMVMIPFISTFICPTLSFPLKSLPIIINLVFYSFVYFLLNIIYFVTGHHIFFNYFDLKIKLESTN